MRTILLDVIYRPEAQVADPLKHMRRRKVDKTTKVKLKKKERKLGIKFEKNKKKNKAG